MEITVENARDSSRATADAVIGVNAEMTSHSHGMNVQPIVTRIGPQTIRVEGMMLHMQGHWTLNVDLRRENITEHAAFDIVLQ